MSTTTNRHSRKRARERYDTEADRLLADGLLSKILKAGKLEKYKVDHEGRKVWNVRFRNRQWRVVTNRRIDHIITFLPLSTPTEPKE